MVYRRRDRRNRNAERLARADPRMPGTNGTVMTCGPCDGVQLALNL